jgi:hypothetical protein
LKICFKVSQVKFDPSPGSGVFVGDLAYGRCHGATFVPNKDFPAQGEDCSNQPVHKLVLVPKRDPRVWRTDERVKAAKQKVSQSQHFVNYFLSVFPKRKTAFHLVVGKQRFT